MLNSEIFIHIVCDSTGCDNSRCQNIKKLYQWPIHNRLDRKISSFHFWSAHFKSVWSYILDIIKLFLIDFSQTLSGLKESFRKTSSDTDSETSPGDPADIELASSHSSDEDDDVGDMYGRWNKSSKNGNCESLIWFAFLSL